MVAFRAHGSRLRNTVHDGPVARVRRDARIIPRVYGEYAAAINLEIRVFGAREDIVVAFCDVRAMRLIYTITANYGFFLSRTFISR